MSKWRSKRLYLDLAREIYWAILYSDGMGPIPVPVKLLRQTILRCKPGMPFECVLADAILVYLQAHPDVFPHPVLYVYVEKGAVYVVTKLKDGQPRYAVRFEHSFGHLANTFDVIGKEQFAKKFDGHGFTLNMLSARKSRAGESRDGGNGSGGKRSAIVSRGAMARARAAGLIPSIGYVHA